MSTNSLAAWKLAYEVSPLILNGGIATASGGALPIISLIEPNLIGVTVSDDIVVADYTSGNTAAYTPNSLDQVFARFYPAAGSTLLSAAIGTYPYANQGIAANAIIAQPTTLSMMMVCPATGTTSWGPKQTGITNLVNSLLQHNNLGGSYTVCTPAFIYLNGILTTVQCVDGSPSHQPQHMYRFDFVFPLLSLVQLQQALNGLMNQFDTGTQVTSTPTWNGGSGVPVGNASNLTTQSLIPSPATSQSILPISSAGF